MMQTDIKPQNRPEVIVVGAGISGIRAALDLVEYGCRVYLVDKAPAIGGILTKLDYQFPDDHCGMCRMLPMLEQDACSQFCLRKGLFHENLSIFTATEVTSMSGTHGQLTVILKRFPQGIDPEKCTGCGACDAVCPVTVPDEFNAGFGERKAVYQPIPHQFSNTRTIDWDSCTRCNACVNACPHDAVTLNDEPATVEMENISAVILTPGTQLFDPASVDIYGYGQLPNVVTAIAFERILSSSGPNSGKPIRPSDQKPIKRVAWLQCVGSRNVMIGADYCSNACCMFAVKEAVLAHKKMGQGTETTIFYMDMRTFGRDFQRYRDRAENERGVRFIRCRLHSIEPAENPGDLCLSYMEVGGNIVEEIFDLVVLSTGRHPAPKILPFVEQEGVCVVESASDLKDIAESVLSAGMASGKAIQIMQNLGIHPNRRHPHETAADLEQIFEQKPRFLVVLCECPEAGQNQLIWDEIADEIQRLAGDIPVARVGCRDHSEALAAIADKVTLKNVNRLVLVVCDQNSFWRRIRQLSNGSGLLPSLIEVVDLQVLLGGEENTAFTAAAAVRNIEMGLSRLRTRTRQRDSARYVRKTALIVGSGPAGLSAAITLAELQQRVVLVEKQDVLGGNLNRIYDPALNATIKALRSRVENHSNITVYKSAEVIWNYGLPGNFISRIRIGSDDEIILNHGITILATGGGPAETDAYGLRSEKGIITQFELERQLYDPELLKQPFNSVVMIQCAGSREEPNNYCSRICCLKTLNNALKIKEMQPDAEIYVFYRDIMTYGDSEKVYTEARKQGILFVPFNVNRRPIVKVKGSQVVVSTYDPILGSDLRLQPDVVVLAVGVVPNSIEKLAQTFRIETTRDGFFQEADSKWRPVDSGREGVFIAGLGRAPVRAEEAMREGTVAAFRALRILEKDLLVPQRLSARVRHAICSRCELCIETCFFGARYVDPEQGMIMVDHAACQGCGACAAVCPSSATLMGDFEDAGIMNAIEAAL